MPERVVIDASVAIAIIVPESGSDAARSATAAWSDDGAELIVPSHFWIEVTNVLVRRHAMPAADVIAGLVIIDDLVLRTVDIDRPTILLALDRMQRSRLSAYDATYVALALSTNAVLATFDRKLAEAAGDHGLLIGDGEPRRMAEIPAEYGSATVPSPAWTHSAVVGAHMADLRRRAMAGGS